MESHSQSHSHSHSQLHSQLIGKYANVRIYDVKDGVNDIECKIISIIGTQYYVVSKYGINYTINISNINNLINVTQNKLYYVGQRVSARIYLNQFDGYYTETCEILSVSQFCNDIKYIVYDLVRKDTHEIPQSNIYCAIGVKNPIYSINNYVGIICDTTINNGTVMSIRKENNNYKYIIKYDDGNIEDIDEQYLTQPRFKTKEEKERDYLLFIVAEEQRLLHQLSDKI